MAFEKYGGPEQPVWDWANHTGWVQSEPEQGRPEVLLRQVGPNLFQLASGFRYVMPDEPGQYWDIPRHDPTKTFGDDPSAPPNNSTDLASVPSWLWWFIASHGRHSRAALLHDDIIDREEVKDRTADTAFRMALLDCKVPILRRWLMWDAVSLASMWRTTIGKLGVVVFALHVLALVSAFGYAIYSSWESLDGILAWPFLRVWSVLGWFWSNLLSAWVGWLWSSLDWLLPSPFDGNAWWRVALIGLLGLIAWRKRWLITLAGLFLILLPTLAVFGSRAVAWVLELALWIGSRVPWIDVPPVKPSFGDPFRQEGGPA